MKNRKKFKKQNRKILRKFNLNQQKCRNSKIIYFTIISQISRILQRIVRQRIKKHDYQNESC